MVKVNLLPSELSGSGKAVYPAFNFRGLAVFLLFLNFTFLLSGIYLRIETIYRKKGLYRITDEYQQAEGLAKKIKALNKEQDKSTGELNFLNGYLKREVIWSEKLGQLRDIIPQEIWLKELSSEKISNKDSGFGNLYLKGALIPLDKAEPLGTLSRFINKLKEDNAFFIDFDNLILTDFRTETQGNIEIMTFAIQLPFKKI